MTLEEYQKRREEIVEKIEKLHEDARTLKNEFLDSELTLKPGTIVLIQEINHINDELGKKMKAIIRGKVLYFEKPRYTFRKVKNDGSESKMNFPDYNRYHICEVIQEPLESKHN